MADSMRSVQTDLRISRTSINESPGSTYLLTKVNHDVHVHCGFTVVFTGVFFFKILLGPLVLWYINKISIVFLFLKMKSQ